MASNYTITHQAVFLGFIASHDINRINLHASINLDFLLQGLGFNDVSQLHLPKNEGVLGRRLVQGRGLLLGAAERSLARCLARHCARSSTES